MRGKHILKEFFFKLTPPILIYYFVYIGSQSLQQANKQVKRASHRVSYFIKMNKTDQGYRTLNISN